MRNLKKFFALVLAMLMIVSAAAVVSADDATFTDVAEENIYADAIADLVVKGITAGTGNGEFSPENGVKRYEMAIFVARAATGITDVAEFGTPIVPFDDVTEYTGAIYYAYANGIVNGYSATKFGPDDAITYVQALKMAVAALGYEVEWEGDWKWPYYNKAVALGLTDGVDVNDLDKALTRAETAQIIYNMIYAAPADGETTLADKNFGSIENGVGVESTYVITATPKQAYIKDAATGANNDIYTAVGNKVTSGHVGIQALVNGVPAGAISYVLATDLGIAEDADLEDYFNRSVTLINYDAEAGTWDDAEVGEAPVIVNDDNVTLDTTKTTATIAGTSYKLVTALSGRYLRNEIVVFDGSVNGAGHVGKNLLTDADGNVYFGGLMVAVLLDTKTTSNYYVDLLTNEMIDEATALVRYGYDVIDTEFDYIDYSALTAITEGAYELHLYNDDDDAEYERAILVPIYVGSYYTYTGKDGKVYDHLVEDTLNIGTKQDHGLVTAASVTYTDESVKTNGKVFTYTFNAALRKVTVKEEITPATKTLKAVNVLWNSNKSLKDVKVTFTDGSVFYMSLANLDHTTGSGKVDKTEKDLGAEIVTRGHEKYGRASGEFFCDEGLMNTTAKFERNLADVAAGKYFGRTDGAYMVDTKQIGADYTFYAIGDNIIFIERLDPIEPDYIFTVFGELSDLDLDEMYVDMWVDAAYKKNQVVTKYGKKVIADLNVVEFAKLIGDAAWQTYGTVYATVAEDGAYQLVEEIEKNEDAKTLAKYGLVTVGADTIGADNKIHFLAGDTIYADGISEKVDGAKVEVADEAVLRTTANTVFYFIDTTTADNTPKGQINVKAVKGITKADAYIECDANTVIYADALGYKGATAGVAEIVIVFDATLESGFIPEATKYYVATANVPANEYTDEATLVKDIPALKGLYDDNLALYRYENAIDLETGEKVTIYAPVVIYGNKVYETDENYVIAVNADGDDYDESLDAYGANHAGLDIKSGTSNPWITFCNTDVANNGRSFAAWDFDGYLYAKLGKYNSVDPCDLVALSYKVDEYYVYNLDTGAIYEGADAIAALNTAKSVTWLGRATGTNEYPDEAFLDHVAVFVIDPADPTDD